MTDKDPFDLWWEWTTKGRVTDFQTIPAEMRDAIMMLTPEERMDRAIVNEAVRTKLSPLRPAGSADDHRVPKAKE
jgi:hypothetical protein